MPLRLIKPGQVRQSCLFHFMDNYRSKWEDLIRDKVLQIIYPITASRSFILKLDPSSANNIFSNPEYILYDRHVTFFEFFGVTDSKIARKKLLTHWHYTERYRKSGQIIELHLYFHYTEQLSAYMRVNKGENRPLAAGQYLNDLQTNSELARDIVYRLINALIYERDRATCEFDTLLAKQNDLQFMSKLSADGLQSFLRSCEIRSERLNKLTEDEVDYRIELLKHNINVLIETKKEEPSEKIDDATETEGSVVEAGDRVKPITRKKPQINWQKRISEFDKSVSAFEKIFADAYKIQPSFDTMLKLEEDKSQLREEILLAYLQTNHPRLLMRLEALFNKINSLDDLWGKLKAYAYAGIFNDEVKKLYEYIGSSVPKEFYCDFFRQVQRQSSLELEPGYVAWIEFLYKESDTYRSFCTTIPNIFLEAYPGCELEYSLLYIIAHNGYQNLFNALLQQSATRYMFGLKIGASKILLPVAVARIDPNGEMIKSLLSHDVATEIQPDILKSCEARCINLDKEKVGMFFSKEARRSTTTVTECEDELKSIRKFFLSIVEVPSMFYAYCANPCINSELMSPLIKQASDLNLMLGLSFLISFCRVIRAPSAEGNFYRLFTSEEQRRQQLHELQARPQQVLFAITFCSYVLLTPTLAKVLPLVVAEVNARMAKLNDEDKDRLIKQAWVLGEQCLKQEYYMIAIVAYNTVLYLSNHQTPSAKSHQRLINTMVKLRSVHAVDTNSGLLERKAEYVAGYPHDIQQFIKFSRFSDALKNPLLTDKTSESRAKSGVRLVV